MPPPRLPALVWMLIAVVPLAGRAGPKSVEVNVNVDLTEEGRKAVRPSREHPAYYYPLIGGYREEGAIIAGEKVPDQFTVLHTLAKTLATQGYLLAESNTPAPTLLLVFHWGSLNPELDDFGDPNGGREIFFNAAQMLSLVSGQSLATLDGSADGEAVRLAAREERYFVVVSAFDYAAAKEKKKVLLWRTKMSTPSNGVFFPDVMAALVASGGPLLGRETLRPVWVDQPLQPGGTVKLGELKVEQYLDPAKPAAKPRP